MPNELFDTAVELWDDESSGSMHVKIIDDNTLEVFNDAKESDEKDRLIYKKVSQFEKPLIKANSKAQKSLA